MKEEKREWSSSVIRASSAGKCARAMAYQFHKFPLIPLSSRNRLVFRLGDTIEAELRELAHSAGIELTGKQKEVSVEIPYNQGLYKASGHLDNTLFIGSLGAVGKEGQLLYEKIVIDFKSCADHKFKKVIKYDIY